MYDGSKWSIFGVLTFDYAKFYSAGIVTVGAQPGVNIQ